MSRLEFMFIPHFDPIVETIENNLSLFRNPLSLLCEIIGFRHYFGDPYSFQNGSNIPFVCFFLLWKKNTNNWFPCNTLLLIEIVLPIPTNLTLFQTCLNLNLISIYIWIIYGGYTYKVGSTYWFWLSLTLDSSPH